MASRWFLAALLVLLGLLGLSWSGESLAQSCGITPVNSMTQNGPAGTTLTYTFEVGNACGTPTGTFAITSDTTGGAFLSATTWAENNGSQFSVTVTLGPTPGGQGELVATCLTDCFLAPTVVNATFASNNEFVYAPTTPTTVVASVISPFTVGTNLQLNGAPGTQPTNFTNLTSATNYGNVTPDGGGNASTTQGIFTDGTYTVRASVVCPVTPVLQGCAAVPPVDFTVQVEPAGVAVIGSATPSTPAGAPLPLAVYYGSASIPAQDGSNMFWSLLSEPPGGDGNIAGNPVAGGAGESNAVFSATVPGVYEVVANSGCTFCAPGQATFSITVNALPSTLSPVTPNPASGTVGVAIPFTVLVETGGVPVTSANIQWTAGTPFTPASFNSVSDPSGEASASFTASAAGTFPGAIVALYDPDGVPASGDEVTFAFDVTVATVPTLAINGGDGQTTTVGSTFPDVLSVLAQDSGAPAVGIGIDWVVTGGSATFVASGPTDGTGEAHISVTPTAPGPITITATRQDAPAATVTFNVSATALPFVLNPVTPSPADGIAGSPMPLTVRLLQGGTPVIGATIQWSAAAPFAPATANSTTDAAGDAVASFTSATAGNFTNAITALYDPDGIPASGDEVSFTYDANIAFVATLAISGGNNQVALVDTAYAAPLQVNAQNSGVPAVGVGIDWLVTSGDATLSAATSLTDGGGNAVVSVTAGATPGPVTISATRQDDATATVSFNLTVDALGSLIVLAGNGQQLSAGVASAPLEVELRDAGGLPIAGAVIDWTTSAGTLASATSTTNGAGVASNTVTTTTPGAVDVTASSPIAAAPAVFALNGALASMPGLSPIQLATATAIDNACPALAALPTRTPQQQDLLDRCRELRDAAGLDPAATIGALDELMADVALTQANAAFNAAQSQFQNLKTRIAALRSGTGGTSFGGLALNTPTGPVSLGTLASAFSNAADPAEVGTDFSRWGFFAAGTIGRGEAKAGARNPAYDFDINGITAGVDYRRNDKWILGGAIGYTRQDTTLPDGRGGLDTSGWTVSAYSTYYQQDSWYMDGVLTWGRNDYELVREISYTLPLLGGGTSTINQTAKADSGGDLLSTAFTFGRDFNRGAWGIGPYGRLLYTRLGFDTINEQLVAGVPGSGLGLSIDSRDISSLASVLGAKFTYTHSTDWGVLMPHVQLEWEHEFKDDPQALEARFINDPTGTAMVIRGDPLDTDYFRLGLGMSMVLTRGRSGFLYYEQLLGRSGFSHYSLALGFRMEF